MERQTNFILVQLEHPDQSAQQRAGSVFLLPSVNKYSTTFLQLIHSSCDTSTKSAIGDECRIATRLARKGQSTQLRSRKQLKREKSVGRAASESAPPPPSSRSDCERGGRGGGRGGLLYHHYHRITEQSASIPCRPSSCLRH